MDSLCSLCGVVIGEDNHEFIIHLQDIAKVHEVATKRVLDIDVAKEVLTNFDVNWTKLRNRFDLNESLQIHLIKDHMYDYFELTGQTLLRVSDEVTEAAHSALRIHDERHGYKIWKNVLTNISSTSIDLL